MNRTDLNAFRDKMNLSDIQIASPQKGDELVVGKKQILRALYNFATSGGAIGAINLLGDDGKPAVIPDNAIITKVLVDVITAPTSGGAATIALGANTTTDIKAATAIASYTGIVACVPVETAASCVKTTADRNVVATVATAALTAGRFYVLVEYIVTE